MQHANCVLATASAIETAAAVRTGTVSAVETTEAAIARIEARDGPINAVVVRDFDRARDQATRVDAAVATGAKLPLAGVPMTVKDVFNVAGLPTTFGLEFARNYRPTEDAPTIRRLRDAGAPAGGSSPCSLSSQSASRSAAASGGPREIFLAPWWRRTRRVAAFPKGVSVHSGQGK